MKITIIIILFFYSFYSHASQNIENIIIQGNQNTKSETIKTYLSLKEGVQYQNEEINLAIKKLYATKLFEDIKIEFKDNGKLIVSVLEAPFITKILIRGNKKIKTSKIKQNLLSRKGKTLTEQMIQSDVAYIKNLYKKLGRIAVTVEAKIKKQKHNRVEISFVINEGFRTTIKNIYFFGNESYKSSELKSIIITKHNRWFNFFNSNNTYDPERLEYDKEMLKDFYQSVGFADFNVISTTVELNRTKDFFDLIFSIEEGPRYKFGTITFYDKTKRLENHFFKKNITIKTGEIFNIKEINRTSENIKNILYKNGFPEFNIDCNTLKRNPNNTIDIKCTIDETDKIYINEINIKNNLKTEDSVIRREFDISEGDILKESDIRDGDRNLRNLDYFENIDINILPTAKKDRYNIVINVEEKSTSSISFDLGYNTAGGLFGGINFLERNLVGTGKTVNAGIQVGKRASSIYAGITEPYFLDKDLSLGFNVFSNHIGRGVSFLSQSDQSYTVNTIGSKITTGYEIKKDLTHEIDYTIKRDHLKSQIHSNSIVLNNQLGKFVTSSVTQTITYDQLDSRIIPKNGYLISAIQEFAGIGGNNKYLKHEIDAKYFKSFNKNKITLKIATSSGQIMGLYKKTVRISDRYNLGDYSLRGFAPSGIGPREKNTSEALGGLKYYTISSELNFPTGLPKELNLTGAIFADAGTTWDIGKFKNINSNNFYHDRSLRLSLGVGIIWVTPFAPIRLDWAIPMKKKHYDEKQTFHLKFSTHF